MPTDYPYDFELRQDRESASREIPLVTLDDMKAFPKATPPEGVRQLGNAAKPGNDVERAQADKRIVSQVDSDKLGGGTKSIEMFVPVKDLRRELEESKARATTNSDGSKVWTNERGQVIRVDKANGVTERYLYDGRGNLMEIDKLHRQGNSSDLFRLNRTIKRPDGKWQPLSAGGRPAGDAVKADIRVSPDGAAIHKDPDQSSTIHRTDGTTETTKPDGSVIERNDLGHISKITYKDGTTREFSQSSYKDRDGSTWQLSQDGKWHLYKNGAPTGETRTGRFDADHDGTVYERDASGEAKEVHYTDGRSTMIVQGREIDISALIRRMRRRG